MRRSRALTQTIILAVTVAGGLLGLGAAAQVGPPGDAPALIDEVSRLVTRHFYDRDAVDRVWLPARATHATALSADATSDDITAALEAMLEELGASHTEHYVPGELAYYELLDIFARDEFRPRLRTMFADGRVAYSGIGVVPRTLEGRVFLAGVYHGGPADRAGLLVGGEAGRR